MIRIGWSIRTAGALLLTLGATMALAQPATKGDPVAEANLAGMRGWVTELLALPADLPLDPPLREALTGLTTGLSDRLEELLPQWDATARLDLSAPTGSDGAVGRAVLARLFNEVALSSLESSGAQHDALMLPLALNPRGCQASYDMGPFAHLAMQLQLLRPDQREQALAARKWQLERVGQMRTALPVKPGLSLEELGYRQIARLRSGQESSAPAMPPVLAKAMLVDERAEVTADLRCPFNQWGLALALSEPDVSPQDAWLAYRFATLHQVLDWALQKVPVQEAGKGDAGASEYPAIARYFSMQGRIRVNVKIDAQGKVKSVTVAERDLKVPGIPGHPAAFSTLLDKASLAKAAAQSYTAAPPGKSGEAPPDKRLEVNWRLE